jgi:hypothetical protein
MDPASQGAPQPAEPPSAADGHRPRGEVSLLLLAEERLRAVRETAARAASDIAERADAHERERDLNSSRIARERLAAELARSLADRAQSLSKEADELVALLGRAGARLSATHAPDPAGHEAQSGHRRDARPEGFSPRSGSGGGPKRRIRHSPDDALRLLAAQMAEAGSTEAQIEKRLAQDFGVSDPGRIVSELSESSEQ